MGSWSTILIWPAETAPRFPTAWPTSIGLMGLSICLLLIFRYVELKWIRSQNIRIEELMAREDVQTQTLDAYCVQDVRGENG